MALFPDKKEHEPPASVQAAGANNAQQPIAPVPVVPDVGNLPHYTANEIQPIEFMKVQMSPVAFEGFLRGNILKYIARADRKNGIEDLKKAQVYLNWLVEYRETGKITVSGKTV